MIGDSYPSISHLINHFIGLSDSDLFWHGGSGMCYKLIKIHDISFSDNTQHIRACFGLTQEIITFELTCEWFLGHDNLVSNHSSQRHGITANILLYVVWQLS